MGLRVGIVVGEVSGDILGAELILELRKHVPNMEVEGVVGNKLIEQGCEQLYSMERLAVMGFVDPLKRLPELLKIRKWLENYFISDPPDLFIGIDAPEFNLGLEKKLKAAAIPTVHYVSPSVWAWREKRIKTIRKAVDLMLTLFPFEEKYYSNKDVPAKFIGHPAADRIPLKINSTVAKKEIGYEERDQVVALLPGSRSSELKNMAKIYLEAAKSCFEKCPNLKFIVPLVSFEHQVYVNSLHEKIAKEVPIHTVVGSTYQAISASDIVIVTSGTATLEVMLHKKPMIIAYKTNFITYLLGRMLVKVPFIGLPNLLAKEQLAKELIQSEVIPKKLTKELLELLSSPDKQQKQINKFTEMHVKLKKDASVEAASAIVEMLGI